ncbi:hypothetical protein THICB2_480039 [Thiomonas sp. CB2]|nr:hypothetical protein THICB2_480039 [Thiomonas sp. CB2]VDY04388.1 protein of unknown function [Thiomonas sp. Bio17B3]VDY08441.1 protein of unknown function [Thiomonas sp. Sup16B3]VDY12639.1 conserved protein of unknown function [Thiomonas sp. OC7]VDY18151.1 protein of unknown function [Thiomonas sp. CB2]
MSIRWPAHQAPHESHTKVRHYADPFDPAWTEYFQLRGDHPVLRVAPPSILKHGSHQDTETLLRRSRLLPDCCP